MKRNPTGPTLLSPPSSFFFVMVNLAFIRVDLGHGAADAESLKGNRFERECL